jgi:hypothetical protein
LAAKEVKENIKVKHANTNQCHTVSVQGAALTRAFGTPSVVTWGEGDAGIAVWSLVNGAIACTAKVGRLLRGTKVVKCAMTSDRGMVVLDAAGNMSMWLLPQLYLVSKGPTDVKDFVLLPGEESSDDGLSVAVLTSTSASRARDKGVFKVLSLEGFAETYALEVASTSHLVQNSTQDNIYLIEYKTTTNSSDDEVTSFHIRGLAPTLPTNRFYHLLNKQRFEEAMQLAETFGLDTDMVFRVRVTSVLDAADKDPSSPDTLKLLMEHLEPITDEEMLVDSCLTASLPSVESTLSILEYGLKRLDALESDDVSTSARTPSPNSSTNSEIAMMSDRDRQKSRLLGVISRLGTYKLAVPASPFNAHDWHHFQNAELDRELNSMLSGSQCKIVTTIWHRHALTYDLISQVPAFLPSIPESTPPGEYLAWLRDDVFPYALPQHHRMILDWVNIRARSFELYEKAAWPENAMEMIDAASCVMQRLGFGGGSGSGSVLPCRTIASVSGFADLLCGRDLDDVVATRDHGEAHAPAKELDALRVQLADLKYLKDEMHFVVSLSDLVLETPMGIVARVLERVVAAELVAVTIEKDIRPYLARHKITGDDFLLDYMRDLMGTVIGIDTTLSGSAWEAKALAIIATMKDSDLRVEATLELMRRASVPCSSEVDALVTAALSDKSCPRLDEIREQHRLMHLKEMMQKYGIRQFNLTDTRLARGLMKHVLSRFDVVSALADALQLVGAYSHLNAQEAYVTRFQNLVRNNRDDQLEDFLGEVPIEVLTGFGRELVAWADVVLSDTTVIVGMEAMDNRSQIITAMVLCLDTVLAKVPSSTWDVTDSHTTLRHSSMQYSRLQTLESEFDVKMNCKTLSEHAGCLTILESELHKQSMAATAAANATAGGATADSASNRRQSPCRRIFRLARLLGLSKAEVMGRATAILQHDDATAASAKLAISICTNTEGGVMCPEDADQLFELVRALEMFCAGGKEALLPDALALAQTGLRSCSRSVLPKQLEMWRAYELAHAVERQCESGDYDSAMTESPRRAAGGSRSQAASVWDEGSSRQELSAKLFLRRFREEGLVLASASTARLSNGFMSSILPQHTGGAGRLKAIGQQVLELIEHLTENGLEQLALRHASVAIGVCAQIRVVSDGDKMIGKICDVVLPRATALLSKLCSGLLSKVLRTSHTDRQLAMGYITVLELAAAFKCYSSAVSATKRNFKQLSELAIVGAGFAKLHKEDALRGECEKLHGNARWWTRLSELSISFDRKQFEGGNAAEHAAKIAPLLIKNCGFDLQLVTDFAGHFGVDPDVVRVMYVRFAFQITDGAQTARAYTELINDAIAVLDDKSATLEMLKAEYPNLINPYDYERLAFAFRTISELDAAVNTEETAAPSQQWLSLLGVLQHYNRQLPPSAYETEFCEELQVVPACASANAEERLPFHHLMFGEPLKILTPELSMESVFKLAPLARVLPAGLSPDDVIVTLVEKLYNAANGPPPDLKEVKEIVRRIADKETAIALATKIADKYPLNQCKLEALELAVSETDRWLTSMSKIDTVKGLHAKVTRMHVKLTDHYNKTLTEWELQENGYSTATTRALLTKPEELIPQLYQEFLIAPALDGASVEKLQKVADAIADRYKLKGAELQQEVVQRWLISNEDDASTEKAAVSAVSKLVGSGGGALSLAGLLDADDDETQVDADGSSCGGPLADVDSDANLNRAVALLRRAPPGTAVKYLLQFAYVTESVKITPRAQLRAFQALFIIAPTQLICDVANLTIEILRGHLLSLCYVMKLEVLGLHHSTTTFQSNSKPGLARAIWKNHRHEVPALPLVLDLCIDYEINDVVLWENTLKQLGQRQRWGDLSRGLIAIIGEPKLWQASCITHMWQTLLAEHLRRVQNSEEESDSRTEAVKQFVHLVTVCPVLLQCKPERIARELTALGLDDAVAAISGPIMEEVEA